VQQLYAHGCDVGEGCIASLGRVWNVTRGMTGPGNTRTHMYVCTCKLEMQSAPTYK